MGSMLGAFNLLYAVFLAVGGMYAFLITGSLISMVMGSAVGVLVVGMRRIPILMFTLSGIMALLMGYRYYMAGAFMPSGLYCGLSLSICIVNLVKLSE